MYFLFWKLQNSGTTLQSKWKLISFEGRIVLREKQNLLLKEGITINKSSFCQSEVYLLHSWKLAHKLQKTRITGCQKKQLVSYWESQMGSKYPVCHLVFTVVYKFTHKHLDFFERINYSSSSCTHLYLYLVAEHLIFLNIFHFFFKMLVDLTKACRLS